jgi:glycosyltransferase involved in cell wall biosynthesis
METIASNGRPPAVSVIIPCYNHGQYIREAIASVEQCDSNLYEIIIVDDGSTDPHTQRVMKELEQEGYHVINQQNQGPHASRNTGIKAARGRYILPVDADDKVNPDYIPLGIEILDRRPEIAVVHGRPDLFGATSVRTPAETGVFDLHRMVLENYIGACAVIRKSALEQCGYYDTQWPYPGWEDWDLWLTMAAVGWQFHFEDAKLYFYRILPDSLTSSNRRDPEKIRLNTEYFCRKHALLLRRVVIEQDALLSNHPRAIRYAVLWDEQGFGSLARQAFTDSATRLMRRLRLG